jgi:selenide,water dikinase
VNESFSTPVVKDLVLVGGGHSHVTVLKRFGMDPMPGVRLTLICRDVHTPYSGMLPGLIAGHYDFDDAHIDLGPLSRFAGARLLHAEATGLDLSQRLVLCKARPPVPFDVLSINIGSSPRLSHVPGATDHVVPVKPINNFVARWESLRQRVSASSEKMRIAVVGAGAGGVEITLAVQFALRNMLVACGRPELEPEFHVFTGKSGILPTHNRKTRQTFLRVFEERQIHVHSSHLVKEFRNGALICDDGESLAVDEVLWVTQAGAAEWLRDTGLALDDSGFVRVADTLQSSSHPGVFAAGDVASVVGYPREKAGVFAVRQGPPLDANLRRALRGRPLEPFRPQKRFLSIISTGDRYAVASRGNWTIKGARVWSWKDWIDRRFMDKYNVLPEMDAVNAQRVAEGVAGPEVLHEIRSLAMRCSGCGAKVGSSVLRRVLDRLQVKQRDDILIGLDAPDDAAVFEVPAGKLLVQTVDAFRAIVDDPYVFGKITAHHCLGDVFAMGAEPHSVLAVATLPHGIESKTEATLDELLQGVLEVLEESGAVLVGGHTSEGAELSLGLAVNGLVDRERILRKSGMRAGDQLILTKPLGTGTLFAADMRRRAKAKWISAAIDSMLVSNRESAACLIRHGATACTDVTGFGLLGHLVEMTRASSMGARLQLDALPVLDGAAETIAMGILSSLQPQNVRLRRSIDNVSSVSESPLYPIIFDPQTSGGMLASIPPERVEECMKELRKRGYDRAVIVGEVVGHPTTSEEAGTIHIEIS